MLGKKLRKIGEMIRDSAAEITKPLLIVTGIFVFLEVASVCCYFDGYDSVSSLLIANPVIYVSLVIVFFIIGSRRAIWHEGQTILEAELKKMHLTENEIEEIIKEYKD